MFLALSGTTPLIANQKPSRLTRIAGAFQASALAWLPRILAPDEKSGRAGELRVTGTVDRHYH
jgi:hypothetical protein